MTIAVAFLGGLVSCLSPCVLPVLPVFVAHVGGAGRASDISGAVAVVDRGRQRAIGFLLGFAGVFVALWVSLGLVGFALLSTVPVLRPIAGLAIVVLGVATIVGWQPQLTGGRFGGSGSFGGSFLLGAGVAVGWTPCIGPTLGAILTWCPPCQQETPAIRDVFEANRDNGLVVVAVDVQEPADTIREYVKRYGLTYTIGVDTYAAIMKTYGVFGLPTHYFIDRQGVIRDRYFGPLKRDQMEQRVELISQP